MRFVQIYHNNWDTHANVAGRLPDQCPAVDQACYGLIQDLKKRGMFDDTLLIWGGEFGRTIYSQGQLSKQNYGRDHHPRCFTMWMAGGGTRPGTIYGETDEFSHNISKIRCISAISMLLCCNCSASIISASRIAIRDWIRS